MAHAAMIRCGLATTDDPAWNCGPIGPKAFPIVASPPTNPMPSDEDRDRALAWLDAGCPQGETLPIETAHAGALSR